MYEGVSVFAKVRVCLRESECVYESVSVFTGVSSVFVRVPSVS